MNSGIRLFKHERSLIMWAIENQTPFAAERTFVRDRDGSEIFLVAVRATFELQPDGSVQVAGKQEPVALAPEYFGKPGSSSLRWDSDLPRTKNGTDILLNASAYAPSGREDHEVEAGFRVAGIAKRLLVTGDRVWEERNGNLVPGSPSAFSTIPVRYERAFGGPIDAQSSRYGPEFSDLNPVGIGVADEAGMPLPNVRYPGTKVESPAGSAPVAGFGAVSCSWAPRKKLGGTYDQKWQEQKQPLLPDDFHDDYYSTAPQDQRISGYLRGGEEMELFNLTPSGYLKFQLPKYSFGIRTSIAESYEHQRANLHTVLVEPDENRLYMVWHSALPCHHTLYTLRKSTVFLKTDLSAQGRESAA